MEMDNHLSGIGQLTEHLSFGGPGGNATSLNQKSKSIYFLRYGRLKFHKDFGKETGCHGGTGYPKLSEIERGCN